jgi:hypothetical protein
MAKKKIPSKSVHDVIDHAGSLPTGVEGSNVPAGFSIPASKIEDVDRAVFNLFEKRLKMEINVNQKVIPVPTIFAGGERVFLVKSGRPPRDRTGVFILPIISIHRTGLDQSKSGPISGRGLGQDTGDLIIKKRLSNRDPRYQALINPLGLHNQDNVASINNRSRPGAVATRRAQQPSFNTWTGELMTPQLGNNIFEIITMPFPHFYTALYEVTFWTQYVQHMNSMLEKLMTSYDAQGNQFKLETDKGYWYVAYVDDTFNSADNFNDYTEEERFVKYTFTIRVPAYLHGAEAHGSGVPFRSFLSAPQISFQLIGGGPPIPQRTDAPVGSGDIDRFILDDVQRLDKRGTRVDDERQVTERVEEFVVDPFGGQGKKRAVRVLSRNRRKGETVISKRNFGVFDDVNF